VRHSIDIPPNDPDYGGQWYLKKLAIEKAWHLSTGDAATKVVVIDDGCDLKHPDLREKFDQGLDVVDGDDDPSYKPGSKNNAHGTQCAGLIAAQTDNAVGMAGVCPECRLSCVRLLPETGKAVPVSADIAAFNFALEQGASVVSNSWGFATAMPAPAPLRAVLEELYDKGRDGLGTLVVFAAGNENRELLSTEVAAVRGVLTVGAINNFDEAAPFSNYGQSLGLTAPAGTYTTDISGPEGLESGDYTSSFGGTSSACPVVAGVAGLVMSARKDMTAREVGELLRQTARKAPFAEADSSGHDKTYGYGIVDPAAALRKALGVSAPDGSGDDAGANSKEQSKSSGGCQVSGASGAGGAAIWSLLTLGLWRQRRRRRW
jgi:subtilisin family serine protease